MTYVYWKGCKSYAIYSQTERDTPAAKEKEKKKTVASLIFIQKTYCMNHKVIETAMQEIMEEQKENRKLSEQLIGKIDHLAGLIESLEEQQNDRKINMTLQRTDALLRIETELKDLTELVRSQSGNVIHEKRVLFFPLNIMQKNIIP